MRNLVYVLSNGTSVNTLNEAKASGLEYRMGTNPIEEKASPLTEKQRTARVKAR